MVVEQRRQQVVGHANCVQVTVEVQVDVFHRNHLRVATTRGATLHAEHGAQRGFAQTNRDVLADVLQRVAEADRRRGLAFTRGGRAHRRHQNHAGVVAHRLLQQPIEVDLTLDPTIRLERLIGDVERLGDLGDGLGGGGLGDFDIRCHG